MDPKQREQGAVQIGYLLLCQYIYTHFSPCVRFQGRKKSLHVSLINLDLTGGCIRTRSLSSFHVFVHSEISKDVLPWLSSPFGLIFGFFKFEMVVFFLLWLFPMLLVCKSVDDGAF